MSDNAGRIASLQAELRDRAAENRELREEAARAERFIEAGDVEAAKTLLRFIIRNATAR